MATRKRNSLFIIGVILIVAGAGISTFATFFVFFYGLPVIAFVAGAAFVWFSGRSIKTKALWSVIPILIFFIYQFLWRWANTNDPETFLVPIGYRGRVHVIFDENCGQAQLYEDGRRLYKIPDNGILLTRFKDEYGFIDQEYFFVDSLGRRMSIAKLDVRDFNEEWTTEKNVNEPSRDSLAIFHQGRTGSGNFDDDTNYTFQEFYIATYAQLNDTFGFQYERKFDSVEHELITGCRRIK